MRKIFRDSRFADGDPSIGERATVIVYAPDPGGPETPILIRYMASLWAPPALSAKLSVDEWIAASSSEEAVAIRQAIQMLDTRPLPSEVAEKAGQ